MKKDGCYIIGENGEVTRITEPVKMIELPPGDWIMRQCRGSIILADRSGQNPAMSVDKEGNWQTLIPKPSEVSDDDKEQ